MLQQTLLSSHRQKSFSAVLVERPVLFSMTLFPSLNHLPLHKRAEEPNGCCVWESSGDDSLEGRGGAAGCAKSEPNSAPFSQTCVCLHAQRGERVFKMEHSSSSLPCFSCTMLPRGNKQRSGQCCQWQPGLGYNTLRLSFFILIRWITDHLQISTSAASPGDTFFLFSSCQASSWPSPLLLWHWHI